MNDIADKSHLDMVRFLRQNYGLYQQNRDLITIGAYQKGSDPRLDEAVRLWPKINRFLQQDVKESVSFDNCLDSLFAIGST